MYLLALWMCFCYGTYNVWNRHVFGSAFLLQNIADPPLIRPTKVSYGELAVGADDFLLAPETPIDEPQISQDDNDIASLIQRRIPNLPFDFWQRENSKIRNKNHRCASYPSIFDLKFNNK